MKKKNTIISIICFIILIVIILWVTKIIPRIMAKVTADNYVKQMNAKLNYDDMEYFSQMGNWNVYYMSQDEHRYCISISSEYFPTRVVFDGVHQTSMIDDKTPTEPIENSIETIELNQNTTAENNEINWDEITSTGVDEQRLFENVNTDDLEKIATLLQNLASEIAEKEREDYQFAFEAKWYDYTLKSKQFNQVLDMGNNALKPLYLIIYKSPNQGLYEYICCMAIQKITNLEIGDWNNSKNFLERFNQKILSLR